MERARSETPPPAGVRGAGRMGKEERVRSAADFDRLRRTGRRGGDDVLRVLVAKNGLAWPRLGCAVSRKVGSAVVRNRLRRLYGVAFRAEKGTLPPGVDVLLTPTRGAEDPTLEAVRASLVHLVTQAASKLPPGPPPPAPPREKRKKPERPEAPEGRKGPSPKARAKDKAKRKKSRGPKPPEASA